MWVNECVDSNTCVQQSRRDGLKSTNRTYYHQSQLFSHECGSRGDIVRYTIQTSIFSISISLRRHAKSFQFYYDDFTCVCVCGAVRWYFRIHWLYVCVCLCFTVYFRLQLSLLIHLLACLLDNLLWLTLGHNYTYFASVNECVKLNEFGEFHLCVWVCMAFGCGGDCGVKVSTLNAYRLRIMCSRDLNIIVNVRTHTNRDGVCSLLVNQSSGNSQLDRN